MHEGAHARKQGIAFDGTMAGLKCSGMPLSWPKVQPVSADTDGVVYLSFGSQAGSYQNS